MALRNLKDEDRDKFDRHYLRMFLQKYRNKLTHYIGMGIVSSYYYWLASETLTGDVNRDSRYIVIYIYTTYLHFCPFTLA